MEVEGGKGLGTEDRTSRSFEVQNAKSVQTQCIECIDTSHLSVSLLLESPDLYKHLNPTDIALSRFGFWAYSQCIPGVVLPAWATLQAHFHLHHPQPGTDTQKTAVKQRSRQLGDIRGGGLKMSPLSASPWMVPLFIAFWVLKILQYNSSKRKERKKERAPYRFS